MQFESSPRVANDPAERCERISLRSLPRANGHDRPRYAVEGCVDEFAFTLPVRFHLQRSNEHPLAEVCSAEICGMRLERSHLNALLQAAEEAIEEWRYAGRFPRYAFRLPAPSSALWPVYPVDKKWRLHELDGPIFEADDLGTLCARVVDYLALPVDGVTLLALSPSLTWEAPRCVIQPIERAAPWLPVYAINGSLTVLANEREFVVSRNGGEEIFDLLRQVTAFLVHSGSVRDSHDLMLTKIADEEWDVLAPRLRQNGVTFGYYGRNGGRLEKNPLPVYENSHGLVAAYSHGDTRSLFMGADPLSLRYRVADSLWKSNVIGSPEHLFLKHNS